MTDSCSRPDSIAQDLLQKPVTETDVLITHLLQERPARSPDLAVENQALRTLALHLTDEPQVLLKTLVQLALDLCQADTAGISLLDTMPNGESIFRWVAIAGALAAAEGGTTPANFSPCGTTLSLNQPQLFAYPERYFTYLAHPQMATAEELLIPLRVGDRSLGTLWVISHSQTRQFDAEDQRLMVSLSGFTTSALDNLQKLKQQVAAPFQPMDAFRVSLNDALRSLADPREIQATASRMLGECLGANRVAYFEVRGADYVVEHDYVNGVEPLRGGYSIESFSQESLAAFSRGQTVASSNVATDANLSPAQKSAYAAVQNAAHIGVPLIKQGKFMAGLAVHQAQPRVWTADEITLTEEVAERVWAAVERARAEAALRESEARLAADLTGMQRLYDLYATLATGLDLKTALDEILALACEFTHTDRGCVQLVSDDGTRLEMFTWRGYSDDSPFINHFRYEGFKEGCDRARVDRQRLLIEETIGYPGLEGTEAGAAADAEGIRATQSTPIINRSGEAIGVLSTQFSQPHRPSDNELRLVDLLAWTAADFVERYRAHTALRESESKYRSLFNSMDEGFCILQVIFDESQHPIDCRYVETNRSFEQQSGVKNAVGKTIREVIPNVEPVWFEMHGNVVLTGEPVRAVEYSPSLNRWFDVNAFRIGDPEAHQVAVLFTDITDRKQAEDALRQSEARFRRIFECEMVPMGIYTSDSGIVEANNALLNLIGYTRQELETGQISWQALTPPEYRSLDELAVNEVATRGVSTPYEKVYLHKDGREIPILIGAALLLEDGSSGVFFAIDLSERKRVEAALRESETRYRMMAEVIPQLVWITDAAGHNEYVNQRFCDYTGLTAEQMCGLNWLSIIHPDDLEMTRDRWLTAVNSGQFYEIEYRFRRHDGSYRWFLGQGIPFKDEQGCIRQWFGTCTDIHESKTREQDTRLLAELGDCLRVSETADDVLERVARLLGEYLKATRCCFAEIDPAADRWTVSHDYTSTAELPSLVGKHPISAYPPDVVTALRAGRAVNITDAMTHSMTAAFYATRYQPFGIRSFIVVPLLREGQWVSGLGVFVNVPRVWEERELLLLDTVTERTWNAVENLRLLSELQISEARFRNMADNAPMMVWVTDPTGYCTYLSQSWYDFTGQTEATGLGFGWLDATHPGDRPSSKAIFLAANDRQEAFQIEYRLRRQDGQYRTCIDAAKPWFGADGTFKGYIGSVIDIDDRKQSEAEREQLLERERTARAAAEQANRLKDEFLAVLSHELRSPLNPILGWTRLLLKGKLDGDRQVEALKTIERNAQLQTQLIEDLLDISRIMQGKLSLTAATVNLAFVIAAASETVRLAAEAKQIHLLLDFEDGIAPIWGDAARLQQVVWNLLTNAVKFTPQGGQVTVELRQVEGFAHIRVIDTGKGINPQFLPHVFDYFRQEDSSTTRKFGGLGLGLAIVRQIVELHGGTVDVESQGEGQGATFIVKLPILSRATTMAAQPVPTEASAEVPLDGIQILLVDDEPDTREFEAFLLQSSGAEVTAVASALEALQRFNQSIPDVLISDIGMAEMDGYTLIQQIRSLPAHQGGTVPTIALTAYASEIDRQKAVQAGFQAYLVKPLDPEALIQTILKQLELTQAD